MVFYKKSPTYHIFVKMQQLILKILLSEETDKLKRIQDIFL